MKISIRKFDEKDIPHKIKWINDPQNNVFLHYDLPLEYEKTLQWFHKNQNRTDRYDAVIEADGTPVGLIGLLAIDTERKDAEYYVVLGEADYLGKGVAYRASILLLEYAFTSLALTRVYLYTETANISAVKLYERIGFQYEGLFKNHLFYNGRHIDRYAYGITKAEFFHKNDTPIQPLGKINGNTFYVKREDFIPFSFGGNKARKAALFFKVIDREEYDCVVTYGSSSSNHCRIVANMAAARNIPCYIISPSSSSHTTANSRIMAYLNAHVTVCPVDRVHDEIENKLSQLRQEGFRPYFIPGGGHGNIGTQAYVNCYDEISRFESENAVHFHRVFLASGTGTTQAGLICGALLHQDDKQIIGISIARKNPRGRNVVVDSVIDYLADRKARVNRSDIESATVFIDDYIGEGYGITSPEIQKTIQSTMIQYGLPLDSTYTGKAFTGMLDYLEKENIEGKNILFIHTGGTPLFFDSIK